MGCSHREKTPAGSGKSVGSGTSDTELAGSIAGGQRPHCLLPCPWPALPSLAFFSPALLLQSHYWPRGGTQSSDLELGPRAPAGIWPLLYKTIFSVYSKSFRIKSSVGQSGNEGDSRLEVGMRGQPGSLKTKPDLEALVFVYLISEWGLTSAWPRVPCGASVSLLRVLHFERSQGGREQNVTQSENYS